MAAFSIARFPGNGEQMALDIPFGYLRLSHIFVFVDNELAAFEWISPSRVKTVNPVPTDKTVAIKRLTDRQTRITDFQDGQTLLAGDLDASALQAFYLIQELIDGLVEGAIDGSISLQNPLDGSQPVTVQWIQEQLDESARNSPVILELISEGGVLDQSLQEALTLFEQLGQEFEQLGQEFDVFKEFTEPGGTLEDRFRDALSEIDFDRFGVPSLLSWIEDPEFITGDAGWVAHEADIQTIVQSDPRRLRAEWTGPGSLLFPAIRPVAGGMKVQAGVDTWIGGDLTAAALVARFWDAGGQPLADISLASGSEGRLEGIAEAPEGAATVRFLVEPQGPSGWLEIARPRASYALPGQEEPDPYQPSLSETIARIARRDIQQAQRVLAEENLLVENLQNKAAVQSLDEALIAEGQARALAVSQLQAQINVLSDPENLDLSGFATILYVDSVVADEAQTRGQQLSLLETGFDQSLTDLETALSDDISTRATVGQLSEALTSAEQARAALANQLVADFNQAISDAQGALEQQIATKATVGQLQEAVSDASEARSQLSTQLTADFNAALSSTASGLETQINARATTTALNTAISNEQQARTQLGNQLTADFNQALTDAQGALEQQIATKATVGQLQEAVSDASEARSQLATQLTADFNAALSSTASGLETQINARATTTALNTAISNEQQARTQLGNQLVADFNQALTDVEDGLQEQIDARATISALNTAVSDASEARSQLATQLTADFNAALSSTASGLETQINARATTTALNTAISNEQQARAQLGNQLVADFNQALTDAETGLQTQINARATNTALNTAISDEQQARSSAVNGLQAQLNGVSASLTEVSDVAVDAQGKVNAMRGVRINANGVVTGYGLSVDGPESEFAVVANRFLIVNPSNNNQSSYPFGVIDGVTYITNARITNALIDDLSVNKLTGGALGANVTVNGELEMGTGRIVFDNGQYMKVQGIGFGQDGDLMEWFGVKRPIDQMSKANAIAYLGTDGSAYFGGALSAGTISNSGQATNQAPDASLIVGPFSTNGGPKVVTHSYTYSRTASGMTEGSIANPGNPSATIRLQRRLSGDDWSTIATRDVSGTSTVEDLGEEMGATTYIHSSQMSGSWSWTDTGGDTQDREYRWEITFRDVPTITPTGNNAYENVGSISQNLSLISVEQ